MPRKTPTLSDRIQRTNIEIPLPEGGALRGWFLKRGEGFPTVIYFYGNGDRLFNAYQRLCLLSERLAMNVICVDYRGYGTSDGTPGLRSLAGDAVRIWDGTSALRKESPTMVYGFSIGTVAAIHLAAQRPLTGLILQAPISSAQDVIPSWSRLAPWYVRPFLRLKPCAEVAAMHPFPVEEMGQVNSPLLVIHGTADETVPLSSGRKIFDAAASPKKAWCEVPNAHHNDLDLDGEPAKSALTTFLSTLHKN
ncbi:MAG: alpha/beta hydrolase [Holophaga sp.]|nr:alpha/beta hydrolase [Holophaga sp.]